MLVTADVAQQNLLHTNPTKAQVRAEALCMPSIVLYVPSFAHLACLTTYRVTNTRPGRGFIPGRTMNTCTNNPLQILLHSGASSLKSITGSKRYFAVFCLSAGKNTSGVSQFAAKHSKRHAMSTRIHAYNHPSAKPSSQPTAQYGAAHLQQFNVTQHIHCKGRRQYEALLGVALLIVQHACRKVSF